MARPGRVSHLGEVRHLDLEGALPVPLRKYITATKRLEGVALVEFSAAHRSARDARAEFERVREELRRASHSEDLDASV
jgi:hypothetical protein